MCLMKELFFSHRLKRYKTMLWKWLGLENIYESIIEGNFILDDNTKVLILTEAETFTFRKKGYDVEIVHKISSSYPRRLIDIVIGLKKIWHHTLPATIDAAHILSADVIEEMLNASCCCCCATVFPYSQSMNELFDEFLVLVKEQVQLAKKMEDFGNKLRAALPNDEIAIPTYCIFKPFVDENKLSDCFYCIYQKFFGALPTEKLEGDYNKPIDLIAYLFVLVEWEKLGNYTFSEKCKKPFFEYINKKVVIDKIGMTERTFHNRVTRTLDDFRNKLSTEPVSSKFKGECWKNDFFIKDFLKVFEIFHGTDYYKELEMRKHA